MLLEFKTLSMMDLRGSPGEILDRVALNGEAFIVERSGQQMACLVPLSTLLPGIQHSRVRLELDALAEAGETHRTTITSEREIVFEIDQSVAGESVRIKVRLPHGYPSSAPHVFAEPIDAACPHRWQDGSLCIFGVTDVWNPGKHNVVQVLELARTWLSHYEQWKQTGAWPNAGSAE